MSEKQILLIKHSWSYAASKLEKVDHSFYKHLHQIAPELKPVFNLKDQKAGPKFSKIIQLIVAKFHKPAEMCHDLKAMSKEYPGFAVMTLHYDTLVIAFLMTMKKILGKIWCDETRDAWTMAFATISHKIERAPFQKF